jgi:rhodanese-related sulfurtransferase
VVETISREELREKIEGGSDLVLVETLTEPYYRHSHLPGAVNLPTEEVGERAEEVLPDKDAEIVVYCMSAI